MKEGKTNDGHYYKCFTYELCKLQQTRTDYQLTSGSTNDLPAILRIENNDDDLDSAEYNVRYWNGESWKRSLCKPLKQFKSIPYYEDGEVVYAFIVSSQGTILNLYVVTPER